MGKTQDQPENKASNRTVKVQPAGKTGNGQSTIRVSGAFSAHIFNRKREIDDLLVSKKLSVYTSGDLEEHGSVMIVKSRSRAGWWLSKCVWCMFSTLLAYVIYYIPMFLIFAWRGIPMKMHLTKRLVTTSVEGFLNWKTADVCAVVLFIPVAVMMFLCLLQMLLEVVWSPAVAIILLLVIQGISAYKQSVFLWGNWGIPVRMLKTPIGYIGNLRCSIAGIIVCIVIGTILFKRRDLLFKE